MVKTSTVTTSTIRKGIDGTNGIDKIESEKRFDHDWGAAAYRKTYSRRAYAAYGKEEDREEAE